MRNLILILIFLSWTQAQAQGRYNAQDGSYEMTYEDLAEELSAKRKTLIDSPTEVWGFERVQAIFGYSFSSMDFNLPSGGSSFALKGIDVRANGQLSHSTWQLEGGLKNYARTSSGDKSIDSKILTASLKNQDSLNSNLQYVVGLSSSFHWINAKDLIQSKNELDLSLNVTGGLRGPLSSQLSWGVDLNAYSPISGKLLKGGIEASLLLSSLL